MKMVKKVFCLLSFLSLVFFSCSNLMDVKEVKYTEGFGKVTCNIYLPQENPSARTAFPSISLSDASLSYEVSVFKKDGSVLSDAIVTRIPNTKAFEISGIPLNVDFKLEVTVLENSNIIMKGNSDILKLTAEEPVVAESITVSYLQTSTGKGSVKLPFDTTAVSSITNIYYSIDGGEKITNNSTNTLLINDISSGSHLITFSFCNIDGTLLYQITEAINVYDNVVTDKWEQTGNNSYFTDDSGKLKLNITPELIKNYELKTIYVDSTNNDSTESGTYYNPYKSIQKAVDKIVNYGNDSDEYTICLLSDVVATDDNMTLVSTTEKTLVSINTIDSKKNITITSVNGIKTLDADNKGRVIYIAGNENTKVNLKNIIVKNGYLLASSAAQKNGAGIYNQCKLELNNVQILSCKLESPNSGTCGNVSGGGIYNDSEGNLTINSAVISDCRCEASVKNKLAYGGGIYNSGICTINSVIITGCTVQGNVASADTYLPKGGGIYNTKTLVLGNTESESSEPDVIIGIGTYNGVQYKNPNRCINGSGGGVYNNTAANLTINSDCVIGAYKPGKCASVPTDDNPDNCGNLITGSAGAGLYCYSNSVCTINGGYISYNCCARSTTGNSLGIGMYLNDNMNCSVKNLEVSYNYSTKLCLGAGFASYNYSFENIKVFGNAATELYSHKGIGAYLYNGCSLKGETWFDETNNIYLIDGVVNILDDLSPKNSSGVTKTVVANITNDSAVTNDTEFLSAETPQLISDNVSKFKITNNGGWELIQSFSDPKKGIAKQVLYVAGTDSTVLTAGSTKNGTKEHPYTSLKTAIDSMLYSDSIIYLDGEITESTRIEISSEGKSFTLAKLSGAATAKCNFDGRGTFITTYKTIEFIDVVINGVGNENNRAFWVYFSGTKVILNNSSITGFNGVDDCTGVYLTAAGSVELKGNSLIECKYGIPGIKAIVNTCNVYLQGRPVLSDYGYISLVSGAEVIIKGSLSESASIIVQPASYDTSTVIITNYINPEWNSILKPKNEFYEFTIEGKLAVKSTLPRITAENIYDALQAIPDGTEITFNGYVSSLSDILTAINNGTKKVKLTLKDYTYNRYSLKDGPFNNCKNITELDITISGSIEAQDLCFNNMADLQVLKLRGSLSNLGSRSCQGCSKLTTLYIPETITFIGTNAFADCSSIKDIYTTGASKPDTLASQSGSSFNSATWHFNATY